MTTMLLDEEAICAPAFAPEPSVRRTHETSASTFEPNTRIPSHFGHRVKRELACKLKSGYHFATHKFEDSISPTIATRREAGMPHSATHKFEDSISPLDALASDFSKKATATYQARVAYRERVNTLMGDAVLDGVSMNKYSELEFWTFLGSQDFFRKGSLFLLNSGNLRAVWKNKNGDQIALQFLGNEIIQYVMFKHRHPQTENISRVAGRDTLAGVRLQIAALDLSHLISA